jgi:hypothetical protein
MRRRDAAPAIILISTALLLDSNIRNSVYSGKIAVPPGGGGLRKKADRKKCFPQETKAEFL